MKQNEICNECGRSVKKGSKLYKDRTPDTNTVERRRFLAKHYSNGDFICHNCNKYHFENSAETIYIEHKDGTIVERSLKVKDMKRQSDDVIDTLKSREIWTVKDLGEVEGW